MTMTPSSVYSGGFHTALSIHTEFGSLKYCLLRLCRYVPNVSRVMVRWCDVDAVAYLLNQMAPNCTTLLPTCPLPSQIKQQSSIIKQDSSRQEEVMHGDLRAFQQSHLSPLSDIHPLGCPENHRSLEQTCHLSRAPSSMILFCAC